MEIMFDTANLADIKALTPIYPISGITSNPTILKAEGRVDFYEHMREIRRLIGIDRSLHIQVVADTADGIVDEAHRLLNNIDDQVYIKIPLNEAGLAAITRLKVEKINITATAIYSKAQGILAVAAGVDYIAPYFNRMESLDIDIKDTISMLSRFIKRHNSNCKILAASFKNVAQMSAAFEAGAHACTIQPNLLQRAIDASGIQDAIDTFADDWFTNFGTRSLP